MDKLTSIFWYEETHKFHNKWKCFIPKQKFQLLASLWPLWWRPCSMPFPAITGLLPHRALYSGVRCPPPPSGQGRASAVRQVPPHPRFSRWFPWWVSREVSQCRGEWEGRAHHCLTWVHHKPSLTTYSWFMPIPNYIHAVNLKVGLWSHTLNNAFWNSII